MTDEQLVSRAQAGDQLAAEALIARYGGYIRTLARPYNVAGGDIDDLVQEAHVGLLKAIRDWRLDGGASFKSFVLICVTRQVATAVRMSLAAKHRPLSRSVREMENDDGELVEAVSLIESPEPPIPVSLALRGDLSTIATRLRTHLSELEAHCLILVSAGVDYATIAQLLNVRAKAIDNAVQRARDKLERESIPQQAGGVRKVYDCPGCGGATVKRKPGRGRPPLCNVCTLRKLAA